MSKQRIAQSLTHEALASGRAVPMTFRGNSMRPSLQEGDRVMVQKPNKAHLPVGTLVLFQDDTRSVLHRLIQKKQANGKTLYYTRGDATLCVDTMPLEREAILGVVVQRLRAGQAKGYLGFWAGLREYLWTQFLPFYVKVKVWADRLR